MNAHAIETRAASDASAVTIAYRATYALLALAIVGASVAAPHNDAALAVERFLGSSIVRDRSIATHLGSETFTASGASSGAVGWLGGLVAYATTGGSGVLATLLSTLAALGTFALVERRARRFGGRIFALGAVALAFACSLGSFGAGGGLVTATFAIALAECLDRPGRRNLIAAALLTCIWCNVAAQGLFAPLLAIVFAFGASLEHRGEAELRGRWIACTATIVAVAATPGLFAFPAIAWEDLRFDRGLDAIVAFHPTDIAPLAYRVGFLATACTAFAIGIRRERAGDVLLFLCAGFAALADGSYLPVFGVLVAPLLAGSAANAFASIARVSTGSLRGDRAIALACAVVAVAACALAAPHDRPAPAFALATRLASDGHAHRLFCSNVDWCGAVLATGTGTTRVFMDARVGAYPEHVRSEQRDIVRMKHGWRASLRTHGVDAMLLRADRQLAGLIALSPAWHLVGSDDEAVLYERGRSAP